MKLSNDGFIEDTEKSNPMLVAMRHIDCKRDDICVFMVAGFGTVADKCKHFIISGDKAECYYLDEAAKDG